MNNEYIQCLIINSNHDLLPIQIQLQSDKYYLYSIRYTIMLNGEDIFDQYFDILNSDFSLSHSLCLM